MRQDDAEAAVPVAAAVAEAGEGQCRTATPALLDQREANGGCRAHRRWAEGVSAWYVKPDSRWRMMVDANGMFSRNSAHPSMRTGRRDDPSVLLPRETHDRRELSNVSGRGGEGAQARGIVRVAGAAGHGGQDEQSRDAPCARRRHGVLTGKPPAGLPNLRPGGRVRLAGSEHAVWCGSRAIP